MKLQKLLVMTFVFLLVSVPVMGQMMPGQPGMGMDIDPEQTAAVVNGEEITMGEVEEMAGINQLSMQLMQVNPQFGQFLTESEAGQDFLNAYRRDMLDELINQELLSMKADELDIQVSEEQEDEYFAQVEEQLNMQMQQQGMTEEEFLQEVDQQIPETTLEDMDDIKELVLEDADLEIEILLEQEGIIDEMDEGLDEQQAQQQQIEQGEAFGEYIEELRDEADIEINEEAFE